MENNLFVTAMVSIIGALGTAGVFGYLAKAWERNKTEGKNKYDGFMSKYDALWKERLEEFKETRDKLDAVSTELIRLRTEYEVLREDKRELNQKIVELTSKIVILEKEKSELVEREKNHLGRIEELERNQNNPMK